MDSINKALQDLKLQDKPNIAATARTYKVERSTLSRRFREVSQTHAEKCQNQQFLDPDEEKVLVQYINQLTTRGVPPTPAMVANFASNLKGETLGKNWSHRFCKRWANVLESRYLKGYDAARQKADRKDSLEQYFALVKQKIQEYDIQDQNIYNIDEKGFLIGYLTKTKRIFTKEQTSDKKLLGALQDGNREWITLIATICADSTSLSPALIY